MVASIDKHPLAKRRVVKKAIVRSIKWYVIIGILILSNFLALSIQYFALAAAFIFILELIYQGMFYRRYFYDMRNKFFMIREGVVARRERTIPYHRVHDVYVDQDILDRMLGLWDVHFTTTESRVFNLHIDGLNAKSANAIRNFILGKI